MKIWIFGKIENIFLRSIDFFFEKKTFFYFLKVNRLNLNRLVVRNSRAQYHHFDIRKTEKILPKLPLPRLVGESFECFKSRVNGCRLPSNGRNFELRRSWLCNQSIGPCNILGRTTFPHVWSTLEPPESRLLANRLFFY